MDASAPPAERGADSGLGGAVTLGCAAGRLPVGEPGRVRATRPLTLIPYHLWANRGPAAMRVWLPQLP